MFDKLKGRLEGQEGLSAPDDSKHSRRSRDSARKSADAGQPGEKASTAPPSYSDHRPPAQEKVALSPFSTHFASVSLHMSDRIRLLGLPIAQRDALRASIQRTWPRGIQDEREYHGSHEFKLNGYPWAPSGEDALHARRLTGGILATLHEAGWILYITTDISRNPGDKDNLFFRHQDPAPAPREWFAITFSKGDRVRLIDAPQSIVEDVLAALAPETQSHAPYKLNGVYEIKLNGYPFAATGGKTMVSRFLCLKLFAVLENNGFTLSASMDQKYGGENGQETDSWLVSRPLGWTPGAPVYHQ